MNDLVIFTVLFLLIVFFESIFHAIGFFSLAAVFCLLLYDHRAGVRAVVFIALLSLVIDSFYFNLLGTFYISIIVAILVHQLMKKLLPYDNLIIRPLTLILCFSVFQALLHLISVTWGQGTSVGLDPMFVAIMSVLQTLVYSVVHFIKNSFYNRTESLGGFKV